MCSSSTHAVILRRAHGDAADEKQKRGRDGRKCWVRKVRGAGGGRKTIHNNTLFFSSPGRVEVPFPCRRQTRQLRLCRGPFQTSCSLRWPQRFPDCLAHFLWTKVSVSRLKTGGCRGCAVQTLPIKACKALTHTYTRNGIVCRVYFLIWDSRLDAPVSSLS